MFQLRFCYFFGSHFAISELGETSNSRSSNHAISKRTNGTRSPLILRIDLITLKLFIAVVEEASIAKVADREHMAASAVSKRIADLEHMLRVQLLERQRRGVSPTPAGTALIRHARIILRDLDQMAAEIGEYSSQSHAVRGLIRARANESALFGFFPDVLSRFMNEYPQVSVDLMPDTSTGVVRAVRENVADVGIFWGDQHADGLDISPCYVDRLVVAAPLGHPLSMRRTVRFAELLDYQPVEQEAFSSIQAVIERTAAESGHRIKTRVRVAGFDAVCRMVQAGFGIGIVPDYFVTARAESIHLVEIALDEPWANRLHKICMRSGSTVPTATRLLVAFLSRRSSHRESRCTRSDSSLPSHFFAP